MRTTLTLDSDVEARLREIVRQTGRPFKEVVNEALRVGLRPTAGASADYAFPTWDLGVRPEVDLTKALALASAIEDAEVADELARRR